MNWLGWLTKINWRRISLQKTTAIALSLAICGGGYLLYSNWSSMLAWFNKAPERTACVDGDIKGEAGSVVIIQCGNGNIHLPAQANRSADAPPPASAKVELHPDPTVYLFALRLLDPRPLNPTPPVVIVEAVPQKKHRKMTRVADAKPRRKAKTPAEDAFWLRKFRAIPREESAIAFQPIPAMTGSCLVDRYMPCWMAPGFGREVLVRVDDKVGGRLQSGRRLY
jgi:hypothetical protein